MHKLVKKRAGQQFCKAQKRGKKNLIKNWETKGHGKYVYIEIKITSLTFGNSCREKKYIIGVIFLKETVVLRPWEIIAGNLVLTTELTKG